jgi:histidine triad (HIT) family protein
VQLRTRSPSRENRGGQKAIRHSDLVEARVVLKKRLIAGSLKRLPGVRRQGDSPRSKGNAMVQDPSCIFCRIVSDSSQCTLLAEEEAALAFMDIHPANEGHCLVIPKAHYATVFDTPPDVFAAVGRLVVRISIALRDALRPSGLSLVQANGEAANQTVPHLHVHVLPRRRGDRLSLNWSRTRRGNPSAIADIAERIREHLPAG